MSLIKTTIEKIQPVSQEARDKAKARLDQLTMPHWALGRLMDLAVDMAGMTGQSPPPVKRKTIVTMAGDHKVTEEGISLYPAEVTPQMIGNFVNGGAGVNALSSLTGAKVVVVDMGVNADLSAMGDTIIHKKIGMGAANIAKGPAMSREDAVKSIEAGIEIATDLAGSTDVFGAGDMGIGNTTPSSAIIAVITGSDPADITGRGTGLDDDQLKHKIEVIRTVLKVNKPDISDGVDILAKLGGFEIGGIAGLILGAASMRKPILIDGFISTAGALIAKAIEPKSHDYMISSHLSVEPGHSAMLKALGGAPLLDMNMRLGEGSGAALALCLVDAASKVLTKVATFEEAAVSQADK
ncbi:Nicotinate-nucleotide--dimethylbenzimidazole phosphoribosyltransferase [hydrothermal vent metagenome]|uniref:Nicotinate-nucleotide--dimethylbenzimidazole phosphoribosyltransferase n=1 Tax=hydrothermal vent metagenome TaxID=652676 RepID=A0A3B1BWY6_9ZZZZ